MKTNLVHTLYRVQKYGVMDIEKFKELLSPEDVNTCLMVTRSKWYSMSLEVFTSFIFKVLLPPYFCIDFKCFYMNFYMSI